jgi:aspartyl/asparaginyl beta-hydroxylase (cupin superfamily)
MKGAHEHREGEDFLFDHAKYHEVVKRGQGRRVVLILDVYRCF